jgi:tetrathionate reductase subunit B
MAKYAMTIDLDNCVGCRSCVIACRAEWELQDGKSRCWVTSVGPEEIAPGKLASTFYVGQCNHCDEPACVKECPTSATYQAEDGLVLVNRELCIGCGNCVVACPFGARFTSQIDRKVEKCTFCDGRIQNGLQPACVQTCPTNARVFGNLEDKQTAVHKKVFEETVFAMDVKQVSLKPNVFYIGKQKDIDLLFKHHQPDHLKTSASNKLWSSLSPMVNLALGGTLLGVVGAFMVQLYKGEKEEKNHE